MKFPFVPDYYFPDIYAIDPERLRARGVKVLLADLDNTLAPYGVPTPSQDVVAWRARLEQAQKAYEHYAEALGIPYEGHAGKPKSGGFRRALARMNAAPEEAAIVGDQIFTDILGGNRAGVLTLLVHPIRFGTVFRALRFGIETPFRAGAEDGRRL